MKTSFLSVVVLGLTIVGCGGAAEPNQATAVQALRGLLAALEAKDHDKALTYLQLPPGVKPEEAKKELDGILEKKEISKKGIDILAAKGKWGKMDEAFTADRAKRYLDRFKLPAEACYGLTLSPAETAFYWDGKQFKIFRCDDVGKLE